MEDQIPVGTPTTTPIPIPVPVLDRRFDAWDGDLDLLLGGPSKPFASWNGSDEPLDE